MLNSDQYHDQNNVPKTNDLLIKRKIHEFAVTATPKPATTTLNDIFMTVKTTKLYHDTRLALIIKTWFQLAKEQVSVMYFCLLIVFRCKRKESKAKFNKVQKK